MKIEWLVLMANQIATFFAVHDFEKPRRQPMGQTQPVSAETHEVVRADFDEGVG